VVAELLGEPPRFAPSQAVRGVVQSGAGSWQLSLILTDGARRQSRVITAPSCEELSRAAGIAVALALGATDVSGDAALAPGGVEPEAAATASDPGELAPAREVSAPPAPVDAAPTPSAAVPGAERALSWLLEGGAVLDASALPSPAPGAGIAVGLALQPFSALAYAMLLPTQREALSPSGSAAFSLFAGGLRACYAALRGVVDASACAGLELGRLEARGVALTNAGDYADWWLAPTLGAQLALPLGRRWYVRASADVVVPTLREQYWVGEDRLVHRPANVGLRGSFALGVAFGRGGS
jgi:hypothetical protein